MTKKALELVAENARLKKEINRQKAEIERLNSCVKSEDEIRAIMKDQMTPMVREIVNEQIDAAVKLGRKEFAEILKERNKVYCTNSELLKEMNFVIDNLVKEMEKNDDRKSKPCSPR